MEKQDSSGTSRFIWDGQNISKKPTPPTPRSVSTPCNPSCMAIWSAGAAATRREFYHFDALARPASLTDASQAVTDNYIYQAYGVVVATTGET